ncbi:PQQ-dependent sugar dehydrogenase, partial [Xanthomonas citri pv. mangiferaeindicae]
MQRSFLGLVCALLLSLAVSAADAAPAASSAERRGDWPFSVTPFATFNEPWAMS